EARAPGGVEEPAGGQEEELARSPVAEPGVVGSEDGEEEEDEVGAVEEHRRRGRTLPRRDRRLQGERWHLTSLEPERRPRLQKQCRSFDVTRHRERDGT